MSAQALHDILIADDHPMMADALSALLAGQFPAARIRVAADYPAALAAIRSDIPDFLLVDGDMPGADPRAGITAILEAAPGVPVLVISGLRDDSLADHLLGIGVGGYLPKTAPPAVMLAAIELVLAGGRYRPDPLDPGRPRQPEAAMRPLSDRLAQVAALLAEGLTNKEIARRIGVSPETVKSQVAQILAIFGAANRTEAAIRVQAMHPSFRSRAATGTS